MGIFHDTCEAIVDRATGIALSGETLQTAKRLLCFNEDGTPRATWTGAPTSLTGVARDKVLAAHGWGICGHSVSKAARVCSKCGSGAPKGWIKCPSCGKWIGNESNFCPHCNHPMHPGDRVALAGGVWGRSTPGVFAQRFEIGDVSRILEKDGLQIQEGMAAILLDAGKESTVLSAGRHNPDSALRKINWFGNPPPRSVVMVEAGDVVLRADFEGLRAADESPVSASAEVTVRFVKKDADAFLQNILKDSRELPTEALCEMIQAEATSAVKDLCIQTTLEDLVKDPERRERFDDAIARALKDKLARSGLELVRCGAVEFFGEEYEQVRAKYGELAAKRREVEFSKAALELMADERRMNALAGRESSNLAAEETMDKAVRAKKVEDYLRQLAQEKGLAEIAVKNEIELARKTSAGELAAKDAELAAARNLEMHVAEMKATADRLEVDLVLKNYAREEALRQAESKANLGDIDRSEQLKTAETNAKITEIQSSAERAKIDVSAYATQKDLEARAAKQRMEIEMMRAKAEVMKGASALELAAMSDDPAAKALILQQELAKLKAQNDAAVEIEKAKQNSVGKDALIEMMKSMHADRSAHDEKIMDMMRGLAEKSIEHQSVNVMPSAGGSTTQIIK